VSEVSFFEDKEIWSRIQKVRGIMEKKGLDVFIATVPEDVYYLSGYYTMMFRISGLFFAAIIPKDAEPSLVVPSIDLDIARKMSTIKDVKVYDFKDPAASIVKLLKKLGLTEGKVGVQLESLSAKLLEELKKKAPKSEFVNASEITSDLRMIKSEEEIKLIRRACEVTDRALEATVKMAKEGVSELDLVKKAIEIASELGSESIFWPWDIKAGPRTLVPAYYPADVKIRRGDFVTIDIGAIYKGYMSDTCRTVIVGEPSSEQRKVYRVIFEAYHSALKAVKPGIKSNDLDKIMRKIIRESGYDKYITHRFGHGVGLSIHEKPNLTSDEITLKPGMTFTIEPGIYPPLGGVRIEDTVLVTESGCERLTKYPIPEY